MHMLQSHDNQSDLKHYIENMENKSQTYRNIWGNTFWKERVPTERHTPRICVNQRNEDARMGDSQNGPFHRRTFKS